MFDVVTLLYYTHKSSSKVRLVTGFKQQTSINESSVFGIEMIERYIALSSKVLGVWNDDC